MVAIVRNLESPQKCFKKSALIKNFSSEWVIVGNNPYGGLDPSGLKQISGTFTLTYESSSYQSGGRRVPVTRSIVFDWTANAECVGSVLVFKSFSYQGPSGWESAKTFYNVIGYIPLMGLAPKMIVEEGKDNITYSVVNSDANKWKFSKKMTLKSQFTIGVKKLGYDFKYKEHSSTNVEYEKVCKKC